MCGCETKVKPLVPETKPPATHETNNVVSAQQARVLTAACCWLVVPCWRSHRSAKFTIISRRQTLLLWHLYIINNDVILARFELQLIVTLTFH
jgi:hypothetical protein